MLDALLVQISASYIHIPIRKDEPQLGQYYLAEYAKKQGFDVKVKKYSSSEPILKNLVELLEADNCKVVGFYVDCENVWTIRRLTIEIHNLLPDVKVLIGGPQVSADAKLMLKRIPYVDIAIIGEGEHTFAAVLKQKDFSKTEISEIEGLAYLNDKGECVFTRNRRPEPNIDEFNFPRRNDYSMDDGLSFDQLLTGRGCVGKCAFCFEGNFKGAKVRYHSVEQVISEIDYLVSESHSDFFYFSFLDDTFIINAERARKICNHLVDNYHGRIKWYCEARVDILLKHLDLIPLMLQAGLVRVQLGGESGCQEVLDMYNKNMTVNDLKTVVLSLYKYGVPSIYVNFIVGGAVETLESFEKTLHLATELLQLAPGCVDVGCSLFSPYVGTPMGDCPDEYGIKIIDKELLRGPDGQIPFAETSTLDQYKLLQLYDVFLSEISRTSRNLIKTLPKQKIDTFFMMFNTIRLSTDWYKYCAEIGSINNYYSAIYKYSFSSIDNLSEEELMISVPFRTIQPVSNGKAYHKLLYGKDYVKIEGLEEAVFMLSSGKVSLCEIIDILGRSEKFRGNQNLKNDIIDIYRQLDSEFLVVWKNML